MSFFIEAVVFWPLIAVFLVVGQEPETENTEKSLSDLPGERMTGRLNNKYLWKIFHELIQHTFQIEGELWAMQ